MIERIAQSQGSRRELILKLLREQGIVRVRDIAARKIHPEYLRRMLKAGEIIRIGRGMYSLPDAEMSEHRSLAEVAKRVPRAVVCLLSALSYHDIGTESPSEIWIALPSGVPSPNLSYPPLRVVHFSKATLSEGAESYSVDQVSVSITTPAKTVADCFKFRNKIGTDVAVEALRECLRARRCTPDEVVHYAQLCRVQNVIRPFMDAML